jgi:hypothetical protein
MKQLCSHSDLWLEEAYFLSSQLSNVDTASYIVIFLKFKKITADYESVITIFNTHLLLGVGLSYGV